MIMATFSCEAGKVTLSCINNKYRVRAEDDAGDSIGDEEFYEYDSFNKAMELFLADTEQVLLILDDSPGDWGGN